MGGGARRSMAGMLHGASNKYETLMESEELQPKDLRDSYETEDVNRSWRCKDCLMALVFLGGVAAIGLGLVQNREGLDKVWKSEVDSLNNEFGALAATQTLGISFGVAVVFSAAWLIFVRYCAKCAVYSVFALSLVAEVAGCVALFYLANTMNGSERAWMNAAAVLVGLLFLYTAHVLYNLWSRVALAASMIKVAGGVINRCPSVFVVDTLLALAKFGWVVLCGAAAWAIVGNTEHNTVWVALGIGLMTYWGLQILGNIVLVATYGALGEWYYRGSPSMAGPLCRAGTVHFGSICFGSLTVAVIETLHDFFQVLSTKGYIPSWVLCCIDRCLRSIESTFDYVNKYGFVQVAVHDESFLTASHRAISFLKYRGLTALIDDAIVGRMAQVGAVAGGLLTGTIPVLVMRHCNHEDVTRLGLSDGQETTLAFAGFFLGCFVVYTLISPFPAMVTALLVCFAEHPEVMAKDHEEEYKTLIAPWESVYGADFVDKAATKAHLDIEQSGLYTGASKHHPIAEELEKLVTMKEAGELSEEEFMIAKAKLLSQ